MQCKGRSRKGYGLSTTPLHDDIYALLRGQSELLPVLDPTRPPVCWFLTFPSGRHISSLDISWNTDAVLKEVDSLPGVPVFRLAAEQVDVFFQGEMYTLRPPFPVQFFSFARMASSIGGGAPLWRYSLFGYVTDQYRVTLVVRDGGVTSELAQRHELFLLPPT